MQNQPTATNPLLAPQSGLPVAPFPDPIGETIDTIIALQAKAEQNVSFHQRWVESVTVGFSRPAFLYGLVVAIGLWILSNLVPPSWSLPRFDPPPFEGLDKLIGIVSLLMTAGVLVRQGRQESLAEQRAQLSLQVHLLTEQKVAKLIALLEELRRDLPDVLDRSDPEAEVMQQAVDPQTVLDTLEQTLTEELSRLQQAAEEVVQP
ncbi:MAG TPA: DUF1003 domain-containing protein [Thermosynechococcaceae cyanobacterium]|jgi:uncharacterized membrane protein